jgi:hypothetical protein
LASDPDDRGTSGTAGVGRRSPLGAQPRDRWRQRRGGGRRDGPPSSEGPPRPDIRRRGGVAAGEEEPRSAARGGGLHRRARLSGRLRGDVSRRAGVPAGRAGVGRGASVRRPSRILDPLCRDRVRAGPGRNRRWHLRPRCGGRRHHRVTRRAGGPGVRPVRRGLARMRVLRAHDPVRSRHRPRSGGRGSALATCCTGPSSRGPSVRPMCP